MAQGWSLPTVLTMLSAVSWGAELGKYRDFRFGSTLAGIAKQVGVNPSDAKAVHRRPALIQELAWRPQSQAWSSRTESAQAVVFSFHNGRLFGLAVDYDRYEIEGLTADDLIEAISTLYGQPTKPAAPANTTETLSGDRLDVLARWDDERFRFELLSRTAYGLTYRLTGIEKQSYAAAQDVIAQAIRIEQFEAPERDAARVAKESNDAAAKLEKARGVNRPKFRP